MQKSLTRKPNWNSKLKSFGYRGNYLLLLDIIEGYNGLNVSHAKRKEAARYALAVLLMGIIM